MVVVLILAVTGHAFENDFPVTEYQAVQIIEETHTI